MNKSNSPVSLIAEQVIQANHAFYGAFLERNFDAMAACWEHSQRTVCIHAGKPPLQGWDAIAASWR